MWFKNLNIYKLTAPLPLGVLDINDLLAEGEFIPCKKTQTVSVGWWKPLGKRGELFTHASGDCFMICRRVEKKIIPASAINLRVEERVEKFEEQECRKLSRKERTAIKEEVIIDMMPNALIDTKLLYAYFDMKNNYLVMNSSSPSQCEALISHFRQMLGSFPIVPLQVNSVIDFTMTTWLKAQKLPDQLTFGASCKMENRLLRLNKANFSAHDLLGKDIQVLLEDSMDVVEMGLHYSDRMGFKLDKNLTIKNLYFSDIVKENAQDAEDHIEQFDIDFSLMTLEIEALISYLVRSLGGTREDSVKHEEQMEITGLHEGGKHKTGLDMEKIAESGDPVSEYNKQAIEHILVTRDTSVESLMRAMDCAESFAKTMLKQLERIGVVSATDEDGVRELLQ